MAFENEAAVQAWLGEKGLLHVARQGLRVLAPAFVATLGEPYLPQLKVMGSRRLLDLLSSEGVERWVAETSPSSRLRAALPELARKWLQHEQSLVEEARAQVHSRLAPLAEPRTHRVHGLLTALRARIPADVAPTRDAVLEEFLADGRLVVDENLPGFSLKATGSELPAVAAHRAFESLIVPDARLRFSPDALVASCSCGAQQPSPGCVHVLAALDAALRWLHQPWSVPFGQALENLVSPAWERALRALDKAMEARAPSSAAAELSWRLEVLEGYGVEVAPYLHRRGRGGQLTQGARLSRKRLLQEHGAALSPLDARIAALLPEGNAPVSRALLLELVDHPRLQLSENPNLLVKVDRARVGLVAHERFGAVHVTAGVDGAALPPRLLEQVRRAGPEEAVFLWDEGARRLTVLDVGTELASLLPVLARFPEGFPPESHGALLEKLSHWSVRLPVALPRSVMGERVAAQVLPVIRLAAQPGGAVELELRLRVLPDSPTFAPGEGARDVHVRRGAGAVHAVRDFAKEKEALVELEQRLPLAAAEPDEQGVPHRYRFERAESALEVLAACRALQPAPELEWVGTALKLYSARGPGDLKVALERKRDWFGVLGGLSVEGERVELARLLDAARRKERFVEVSRGSYVEIEEALLQHLAKLGDHTFRTRHGLEVGPSAVETLTGLENAGARVDTDATWQRLVERIFAAQELEPRLPAGLKAGLRGYQVEAFRWATRLASWDAGGVLADDMGLGKTVQALALLLDRAALGPALVLAPTSVGFNWVEEAKRFAPSLRLALYSELDDRGAALERLKAGDVLVLSYGLLTRDIERLAAVRFSTVVFDEAQSLKNAQTQRFRAARALQGDFKLALSGTPLENHLGELWAVFAAVFPGLLGSWEAFRTRFAHPIENGFDPTAAPALARVLQPFLLRRTKAQVESQLPPRTEVNVPVVLSPEEWTLYEDARLAALSDLETPRSKLKEQERRIQILAALTRLRLLASHPRLYDAESKLASSKLERLVELIDELVEEGQRVLVFSQFTSHLALVREVLEAKRLRYEYLDGQTPPGARAQRVKAFQEGSAPLFLISLKAGGTGLNLTAATSVIHLDPWWNPAVEDQASDRAHRIGQKRPVTIYRLVARGTVEEQMLALHAHKRALAEGVLAGKELAGRLSNRELLALLAQRGPESGEEAQAEHESRRTGTRH